MIHTRNLTKYYDTKLAVAEANLYVSAGEVCGLIGPNGAGKTTLLKMLAGLLRPSRGRIEIAGLDVGIEPKELQRVVGYVPDVYGLYDELNVTEFLEYFAFANRVAADAHARRIQSVLELTDLTSKRDAPVGALSRGMRQRLLIAKTLLHAPQVLLLDEPSSGLDPLARIELRDLIRNLSALGTTLIVSSHILTELADFCTSVVIMEQGHIIRSGKINALIAEIEAGGVAVVVEILAESYAAKLLEFLCAQANVEGVVAADTRIEFRVRGERDAVTQLHRALVAQCDGVLSFYEKRLTVEDIFMNLGARQVA